MKISFLRLADPAFLPEKFRDAVVAIGNFDGVHRGHQTVLQCALDEAKKRGKPAIVLTFEPHPRTFLKPESPVDRLTGAAEKAEIFRWAGFDAVIEQVFTNELASCKMNVFIKKILLGTLAVNSVVTGENFHFGYQRQGNSAFLQQAGQKLGFGVHVVDRLRDASGTVISSSRIRALLRKGLVKEAAGLLGYRYTVTAQVIRGSALGCTLGFPTANMSLPPQTSLRLGIYAVRFRSSIGKVYNGVANFGFRPTINKTPEPLLETYIFDMYQNLYDEKCSVSFFSFIRREKKFDGLDLLMARMYKDEAEARMTLAFARPLSLLDDYLTSDSRHDPDEADLFV
ncbi:MAG: riboflavin kinase / FMN adenylyltransferase [Candidatus Tokpelaia sp. JSC085]|nr:MAG: riboflavin kinase / FMN adenylyltransferase [Candidatus Tokpelaia sp. JSC085]